MPDPCVPQVFSGGRLIVFECEVQGGWPLRWVSGSVTDLLGFAPQELVERGTGLGHLVHPDDFEFLLTSARAAEDAEVGALPPLELRLLHADGRWLWVRARAVLARDAAGAVVGLQAYAMDITDHRAAVAELREQRERADLVLEGTRLGRWDWDPRNDAVVFDARWAEMLGLELSEIDMSLESWRSRVHPDDLAACFVDIERHVRGEADYYENVHRMRHRDGHWVWILDRGRIVERDELGRPARFAGTHTDISAQKKAELAAREADRAKSVFLARMSHEIRTPLNGVLGVLQLLQATELDAQQQEFAATIRESGETLLTIIDDILDLSKVEAGELRIDPHDFQPRRMLRHVHDLHRERAQSKGLQYVLEVDDGVPDALVGDDHRLRQVLSNLLSNAVKFTSLGTVAMRVRAPRTDDGRVNFTVRVADTGPGIADVESIWQPFRQENAGVAREHGGTGLGLSISRQLATAMGGSLIVESTPGAGSTFVLRVPLDIGTGEAASTDASILLRTDALPRLRVLVAEDNRVNQMVIRGVLGKLGQDVTVVENGQLAVEACEDEDFDLVLMDIHMPVLDGFSAARRITASIAPQRRPRIVAISADAFAPSDEHFADSGLSGQVTKPFRVDDVARVIAETAEEAEHARP